MLLEYATGSMNGQASVLMRPTACADLWSHVHDLESLGGALIDDIEPAAVGGGARQKVMAMWTNPSRRLSSRGGDRISGSDPRAYSGAAAEPSGGRCGRSHGGPLAVVSGT